LLVLLLGPSSIPQGTLEKAGNRSGVLHPSQRMAVPQRRAVAVLVPCRIACLHDPDLRTQPAHLGQDPYRRPGDRFCSWFDHRGGAGEPSPEDHQEKPLKDFAPLRLPFKLCPTGRAFYPPQREGWGQSSPPQTAQRAQKGLQEPSRETKRVLPRRSDVRRRILPAAAWIAAQGRDVNEAPRSPSNRLQSLTDESPQWFGPAFTHEHSFSINPLIPLHPGASRCTLFR
jgi:hypothetical protein